jgi:hypothetical protein
MKVLVGIAKVFESIGANTFAKTKKKNTTFPQNLNTNEYNAVLLTATQLIMHITGTYI